ncbi:MAG: HAMP domain-containing histidine kinase [Myxococcales bacterium]|nr:HAMP domain-containing histidine kinase [Myxococcales bacterium]
MSLRRWLLGSLLLGLLLVLAAAGLSSRWAWRQASRELVGARVEQVLEAARRMEAGASMEDCEAQLAIDLRFEEGPPEGPPHPPGMRGPPPGDHGWRKVEGRGRPLWIHDPPGEVAAYVDGRWILLHEDLVGPAVLRVLGVLLLVLGPLVGGASWFVDRSLRPVAAAQDAMGRIAQGDLGHRLDEAHGPAELRAVARHFNAMADVVEARLRLERQLMAGLSHELRTPLTRIRMEVELARLAGGDTTRLERVDLEVERVDELVAELLELSRLEVGDVALEREDTDLAALARTVAARWPAVDVRGEGRACVDRRLIGRALENLLSNCERHAPDTEVVVTVTPSSLTVEDGGGPMPEEVVEHLFEPFWRAPGAQGAGHGVGLGIVRQVAVLHGGRAIAEVGDRGLRVTLTWS